ncbi:hypothetical protein LSM04_000470 [Trypanosoma melophagium]|uniref:uncharacterized protein n=1 Tax=Trypanosoma melophagium TaxID=715481 RepID=UPI00351A188F|nr:hypothetical protein LSM04_000470 [Trypanosoma melophagium]
MQDSHQVEKKPEEEKHGNQQVEFLLGLTFVTELMNQLSTMMTDYHNPYGEHLFGFFVIHMAFARKFIDERGESILRAYTEVNNDNKDVLSESFIELLDELIEETNCIKRNGVIKTAHLDSTISNMDENEIITRHIDFMGDNECNKLHLDSNASGNSATLDIPLELRSSEEIALNVNTPVEESNYDEPHSSVNRAFSSHPAMVDAATITVSPIQIGRAVGRSLPVSPLYTNEYTETISPVLISRGVVTSPFNEEEFLPQVFSVT